MNSVSSRDLTQTGFQIAITREGLAYLVIILVAALLRVPALGDAPLSDYEARQAMAAWQFVSTGEASPISAESPLLFAGAALSFSLAGASNAAARLLPLLAGIALVLLPLGLRKHFGRLPMIIASGLLALSPGLVASSRRMDGTGPAMLFLLLALWAFWRYTSSKSLATLASSSVLFALALLSDFFTLPGVLGLLAGVGALMLGDDEQFDVRRVIKDTLHDVDWRIFIAAFLATIFIVSTLGLTNPRGLGDVADMLGRLVSGLVRRPRGAPLLAGVLLLYEPLIVLFGLIGLVRGLTSQLAGVRFLSGWALGAMFIGFIYPGALPSHVLWIIMPLALLAALILADIISDANSGPGWSLALHVALVILLLATSLLWTTGSLTQDASSQANENAALALAQLAQNLGLNTLSNNIASNLILPLRMMLAVLLLVLLAVTTLMWATFWSGRHAWRGLALGVFGIGLLTALNGAAGLAYTRASDPHELWNINPSQPAIKALALTAEDVSSATNANALDATFTVQGSPYEALAWALRDFHNVTFVDVLGPQVATDLVMNTSGEPSPVVGEKYIGQDFVIAKSWQPARLGFQAGLKWLFFRDASTATSNTSVILWVREDIYLMLDDNVAE